MARWPPPTPTTGDLPRWTLLRWQHLPLGRHVLRRWNAETLAIQSRFDPFFNIKIAGFAVSFCQYLKFWSILKWLALKEFQKAGNEPWKWNGKIMENPMGKTINQPIDRVKWVHLQPAPLLWAFPNKWPLLMGKSHGMEWSSRHASGSAGEKTGLCPNMIWVVACCC